MEHLAPSPLTIGYYQNLFEQHGRSPEAVGWKGKVSARYAALINSWVGHADTILDYGCGVGGLAEYLHTSQGRAAAYKGVDVVPEFIAAAQDYFANYKPQKSDYFPMTDIRLSSFELIDGPQDIRKEYDHVVCCGVFNFMGSEQKIHAAHVQQTLAALYEIAKKGLHVNFLAPDVDYREPNLYYQSLHDLVNMLKPISRRYVIDRSAMPYEFTVHIATDKIDIKTGLFAT